MLVILKESQLQFSLKLLSTKHFHIDDKKSQKLHFGGSNVLFQFGIVIYHLHKTELYFS